MDKMQSLFKDEELEILLFTYKEMFEQISNLPLRFEELEELEGENND